MRKGDHLEEPTRKVGLSLGVEDSGTKCFLQNGVIEGSAVSDTSGAGYSQEIGLVSDKGLYVNCSWVFA